MPPHRFALSKSSRKSGPIKSKTEFQKNRFWKLTLASAPARQPDAGPDKVRADTPAKVHRPRHSATDTPASRSR
jgi:hypothetical protein